MVSPVFLLLTPADDACRIKRTNRLRQTIILSNISTVLSWKRENEGACLCSGNLGDWRSQRTLTEDSCGDGLTDSDVDDVAACFDNTGRTSVTKIDLSGNQLASLPAGLFNGLDALQEIYLSSNQLASLPVGLFNGLDALLSILLHDNQLASLPAGLLDGLDSLVFLSLYGNQLTSLPAGLFNGPDGLQSLYLNDNQLASLPAGLFDGLDSLSIL
ncbi:Hypothetical leucine rich repeat protein (Partial), partial [Ectocarpus siliculosus]